MMNKPIKGVQPMKVVSTKFAMLVYISLFLLSVTSCREEKTDPGRLGEKAGPGEENVAAGHGEEDVVAMIGDEVITREALQAVLNRIPERMRKKYRDKGLDHLIETKVFSAEARKAGLDQEPEIKEALEREVNGGLSGYFINKYVHQQAQPSEEAVKAYYEEHKDEFVVPEGVLIQHILVKKQEQAEAILKELQEGASFEAVARKKSIDPSWKKGGRQGWLYKGRMEPALEKVAFGLEVGQLSDVFQTKKGYQIIQVQKKSDTRKIDFAKARARIDNGLTQKKMRELLGTYYKEAKIDRQPAEEGVLVKVGDEAFTEEDLAPMLAEVSEKNREKVKQRWIKFFVETKVFGKEARKVGLDNDPEVAEDLQRRTDEFLAKAFRKRFIDEKFPVADKEIADYYQSHLEKFRMPVKIRARSIVVKTREEAEEILKELEQGASFKSLAMERSIDPTFGPKGGDMGWFGQGEREPALEKVALSMENGQVSDIIETETGYGIIELMNKKGGQVQPLEGVGEAIKASLASRRFKEEKERYYEKAGVVISH
jgi:parvulin-like peptidyl-prolyl isomerase